MDAPNGIIRSRKGSSARDCKVVMTLRSARIGDLGIGSGRDRVETNVDNKATHSIQARTIEFIGDDRRMVTGDDWERKER